MNPRFLDTELLCKVIEARTKPARKNVYGMLKSGYIKLLGPLGVIRVHQPRTSNATLGDGKTDAHEAYIFWDTKGDRSTNGPIQTTVRNLTRYNGKSLGDRDFFCMPIRVMNESQNEGSEVYLTALLLLPVGRGKERGLFRRMGLMKVYDEDSRKPEVKTRSFGPLAKATMGLNKVHYLYESVVTDVSATEYCITLV